MATVVTIGRNVGSDPLSREDWERFVSSVVRTVRDASSAVYFVGYGRGIWEGATEDAFTIVTDDIRSADRERFRLRLSALAHKYRQDAIAVTSAPTELVS